MRGEEGFVHYSKLVAKRISKAEAMLAQVDDVPLFARDAAQDIADSALRKAINFTRPRPWHVKAAKERLEKYGMPAAAGFLRAHGWDFNSAMAVLLPDAYSRRVTLAILNFEI